MVSNHPDAKRDKVRRTRHETTGRADVADDPNHGQVKGASYRAVTAIVETRDGVAKTGLVGRIPGIAKDERVEDAFAKKFSVGPIGHQIGDTREEERVRVAVASG